MTIYIGGHGHGQAALCEKETGLIPAACTPEEALRAPAAADLHLLIREVLRGRGDAVEYARRLLRENPDAALTCDEIGGGIVPLDPFERRWREETGRALGVLADDPHTHLIRVWYGLPEVLK